MDIHAFASLAQIRVLLIPVGFIPPATFEKYASEIRSFETIALSDLPENKDDRARFMPKDALQTGHLHLSFITHPPTPALNSLSLLRPSLFPLAAIGIACATHSDSLPALQADFSSTLLDRFPAESTYPVARNCFVFDEGDGTTDINVGEKLSGLVVIPGIMGNKRVYIGTLLADMCSSILGELALVYQRLESPLGNEYLNASQFPTLPPLSEMPLPLSESNKNGFPAFPSHNSQTEISRSILSRSSTPTTKRNPSYGPGLRASPLSPKRRQSAAIGVASSHGRLFKVLGDFFLLAGRTEDAEVWYSEAITMFKPALDPLWQASALEGLATVLVVNAWASNQGLQNSSSGGKHPWTDVTDKLVQAAGLYSNSRTVSSEIESDYALFSYLYCSCILRHSSLLFSIWSAKGWGPLAFTSMLHPGPSPYIPPTLSHDNAQSWTHLERLSLLSGISRDLISTTISQAHGPWLLHLGPRERLGVLQVIASTYSCLGFRRKEIYVLREVLGCIMDLIVCGRHEDGTQGQGSYPSSPMGDGAAPGEMSIRLGESKAGNDGILRVLDQICRVMGIDLHAVKPVDPDNDSPFAKDVTYDDDILQDSQDSYGWPELQIGVVTEVIFIAEALPDFMSVTQYALSSLKSLLPKLNVGNQHYLFSAATRALATAQRRRENHLLEFWSGRLVVSIALASLPIIRLPIEKPMSALSSRASDHTPLLTGGTDPFLYNPRRLVDGQGVSLVVQYEPLEFVVTLQNPYAFDLELESLSLSTSGVDFESSPVQIVIPAESFYTVTLTGKALAPGTLVLRGCIMQTVASAPREYILPQATDEEEDKFQRNKSLLLSEADRSKYSGSEKLEPGKRRSQIAPTKSIPKYLRCKVIPEQPLLRIRRTSVTRGALMLYDGEITTMRISLENVSELPVDFIRLVFDDSTIEPAQQALSEGDLSVFDTYETEYDLLHRPVFLWNKEEKRSIAPRQMLSLTIQAQGKVGCTEGAIHVSYSYIHRNGPEAPEPSVFHTRQISYPLSVTVYQMLECLSMDIIPLPSHFVTNETDEESQWCLFSLEIRNCYGTPFDVTLTRIQKDASNAKSTTNLPPGSTSRIVIPLKKFLLSSEQTSRPIPTLSDRQFVVNKSTLSTEEETIQRELFWYREELFNCLTCRWQETGSTRNGDLLLRKQRMTMPMLDNLRTSAAIVHLTMQDHGGNGKARVPTDTFLTLQVRVTNQTFSTLWFSLNIYFDPADLVLYDGTVSDVPISCLEPGASEIVHIPVLFLGRGQFEITAAARAVAADGAETEAGRGFLHVVAREST